MNRHRNMLCTCAIVFAVIVTSCAGPVPTLLDAAQASPVASPQASATAPASAPANQPASPQPSATPPVIARIKVETYNILYGGGFDERVPPEDRLDRRIEGILEYIAAESPDILGLQELNGWELGEPRNIDQFAKDLNMNAVLAPDESGLHNGLLTKYKILESKNLSPLLGDIGGLYVRLDTPVGPVNVFNVHITPRDPARKACKTQKLLDLAEAYKHEPTILMGDFNDFPDFSPNGWVNPVDLGYRNIDQIWVSPVIKAFYEISPTAPVQKYASDAKYQGMQLFQLSDHMPVARIFNIAAIQPGSAFAPQLAAGTVPLPLQKALSQAVVLDSSPFTTCSGSLGWNLESLPIKDQQGLALTGMNDWSTGFGFRSSPQPGLGLLLDFTFTGDQPEFEIYLAAGEWSKPDYRRFGAYLAEGKISKNYYEGPDSVGTDVFPGSPAFEAGHVYSLFTGIGKDNQFVMIFWEKANPEQYSVVSEAFGENWDGRKWRFNVGANKGEIIFPGFSLISFE